MTTTLGRKSIEEDFLEDLKKYHWLEGYAEHMYLDQPEKGKPGNVTIGRGHLIADADSAKKLPFRFSYKAATPEEIEAAYDYLKKQTIPAGEPIYNYKKGPNANLVLREQDIDKIAREDIKGKVAILEKTFPNFDRYPYSVQKTLLDMWFNIQRINNQLVYKDFKTAIRQENWSQAAFESHMRTQPSTPDGVYPRIILRTVHLCKAAKDAKQDTPTSFCYIFKQKIWAEGWPAYTPLLEDLAKYGNKWSTHQNKDFVQKLKAVDVIFSHYIPITTNLKETFPEFNGYPISVQKALVDMWFNIEGITHSSAYQNFKTAIRKKDWSQAALESHQKTSASTPDKTYLHIGLRAAYLCQAKEAAEPKMCTSLDAFLKTPTSTPTSFCNAFRQKLKDSGWSTHEAFLKDILEYGNKELPNDQNKAFIDKLKKIDTVFDGMYYHAK